MDILNQMDFSILNFIAAYFQCDWLNAIMPLVTALGDNGFIWGLLAAALLTKRKYRKTGIGILAVLVLGFLVCNLGIKPLVARIRPFEFNASVQLLVNAPLDYSFPSGHAESSFAAVTVLFLNRIKGRYIALVLAVMIAFSRLYLYVHYPTDVLAGGLLGICLGFVVVYLVDRATAPQHVRLVNLPDEKKELNSGEVTDSVRLR